MIDELRVVHLYKDLPPVRGGIESHVETLTRFLAANGVDVEVICSRPPGTEAHEVRDRVRIHRCGAALTVASTPIPPGLPSALRRSGADVVHLHYPWPPSELAWMLAGRRRPLVVSVHAEVVRYPRLARVLSPLTQRVFGAAQAILVSSDALVDIPVLQNHAERVHVVPYGIDLRQLYPRGDEPDPLPRIVGPRIVFVGRFRHYKALDVLADAVGRLGEAQLVVIGDGPERRRFEDHLELHGCRQRAHLLGTVDDVRRRSIVAACDVAVLPSDSRAETFGLAIAEAQACGVPAVVTDVGTATVDTIDDRRSGRIVPPRDAGALAEALAWCLSAERSQALRAAARSHAERHLDAHRMAADVLGVYESVTARARG